MRESVGHLFRIKRNGEINSLLLDRDIRGKSKINSMMLLKK